MPFTPEHLPDESDFRKLLEMNELAEARCRLTVTTGTLHTDQPSEETHPTVLASAAAQPAYPAEMYTKGMTVMIAPYRQSTRDPIGGHKTINYLPRLLALSAARENSCSEAIWFTTDNRLAEGSISNVFLVTDKTLKTPPLDTPVLPGITRAAVLELAQADGQPVAESPLTINDLLDADEVFLTNSVMEVMPVTSVEQKTIRDGRPGKVTSRLAELYRHAVRKECPPS
jgi:branched-subunit amino acid aminotransferase/4-amino-4-deoxychorismate lyase